MKKKIIIYFLLIFSLIGTAWTTTAEAKEVLTLEQAIETAVANNNQLQQAKELYQQKKSELELYQKKYNWQFDFSVGSDQDFQEGEVEQKTGGSEEGYLATSKTDLTIGHQFSPVNRFFLTQQLFDYKYNEVLDDEDTDVFAGGSLRYEHDFWTESDSRLNYKLKLAAKEIEVRKQKREVAELKEQIEFEVVNTYYNLLELKEKNAITEDSLAQAEQTLEMVKAKVEAGEALRVDEEEAQLKVEEQELALERIKADYELALLELADALNTELGEEVNLAAAKKLDFTYEKEEIKQRARENSWKLAVVEKQIERQEQKVDYLANESDFSLQGVGEVDWTEEEFDDEYRVGLYFNYQFNTFTNQKEASQLSQAELTAAKLKEKEADLKEELTLEVKKNYQQLLNYEQEIEFSKREIANAEKSLKIAKERYQQGTITLSDLLTAQLEVKKKEQGYIENLLNYNRQVYQLKQLLAIDS